jgi:hypothetical protein
MQMGYIKVMKKHVLMQFYSPDFSNFLPENINERATVGRCVSGFEPVFMYYYMFSTGEVSPAYGIFHYVFKKGKKQLMRFY